MSIKLKFELEIAKDGSYDSLSGYLVDVVNDIAAIHGDELLSVRIGDTEIFDRKILRIPDSFNNAPAIQDLIELLTDFHRCKIECVPRLEDSNL